MPAGSREEGDVGLGAAVHSSGLNGSVSTQRRGQRRLCYHDRKAATNAMDSFGSVVLTVQYLNSI